MAENPMQPPSLHPRGEFESRAVSENDEMWATLKAWFRTEPGRRVVEAEREVLAAHLSNLFGYNLLQVGCLPDVDLLATSRVLHRCIIDLGAHGDALAFDGMVRARASALPVESDRIDVVVLPHVLEFETSPHEALREAARVLIPQGHLLMTTFSPLSLLGVWRMALGRRNTPPWNGRFFTLGRVRDWLELLGFELIDSSALFFRPPVGRSGMLDRIAFMDALGRRLCPMLAGCHVLLARKRVATLTPIRPRFSYPRRLVGVSLAGPPARVSDGK